MKVNIKPYLNLIGPHQIANILCFWSKKKSPFDDKSTLADRFGNWLATASDGTDSRLSKFCEWVHSKRKRKISVRIDDYDVWSMDHTLSHIIYPMLVKLKKQKHGSPLVDNADVPENLHRPTAADGYDIDENHHARWDWLLDEMIWAFDELRNDCPSEEKFIVHPDGVRDKRDLMTAIASIEIDKEGLKAYNDRMKHALCMFGKYYRNLWS